MAASLPVKLETNFSDFFSRFHELSVIASTNSHSLLVRQHDTPKKTRVTLSVADKLKMLDRIKAGESRQKLVAEMGIAMRTLERIVANEEEIRQTAASHVLVWVRE